MKFMLDSLRSLGTRGAKLIRLDAFGYATKAPGTRCFFQVSHSVVDFTVRVSQPATHSVYLAVSQSVSHIPALVCALAGSGTSAS